MACKEAMETPALETVISRCGNQTATIVICTMALWTRIQDQQKTGRIKKEIMRQISGVKLK